jgi:tRNA dimethylallyltransferase
MDIRNPPGSLVSFVAARPRATRVQPAYTRSVATINPVTSPNAPHVIAVVGATAAGKSELAVELALRLGGEAVNADSMQLYRGMNIGTAKLSVDEMRGIPHHLLDIWDVTRTASVAEYQRLSAEVIADIRGRGRLPVLVGGSGLYVRAALDHLEFPGTDPAVRARLEEELAQAGPAGLHERLRGLDPAAAESILPSNGRRIVRALEVIEITGRPFTATLPEYRYRYDAVAQIGLSVPREELDERIALRVERMWEAGLVDEVRRLEKSGLRDGLTAGRALGYAQVLRVLAGEWTQEQAKEDTIRTTRRFARRQESWFRRDPRVRWLPHDAPDLVDRALALVSRDAGDPI